MMVSMQRQAGLAAFAMCAVLASSVACTSGSAAPNLSTASASGSSLIVTTSVTPTVSPKPTSPYPADVPLTGHNVKPGEKPPLYPDVAKVKSQAGANAFAEFFMRTLDWMYATTNPSYVKHYYSASCGLCSGLTTGMTKTAAQKHWYEGGRFTVHPASGTAIAPVTAPADYCSTLKVDTTAASVVNQTAKIFNGDGAHSGLSFKICLKYAAAAWQTTYLART
jgi:hypothetical protein